jgi:hypothetical protein
MLFSQITNRNRNFLEGLYFGSCFSGLIPDVRIIKKIKRMCVKVKKYLRKFLYSKSFDMKIPVPYKEKNCSNRD